MTKEVITPINDNLILISGKSATGKSTCLMGISNPSGVLYLNCENGKKLPFKSEFIELLITDPLQVYDCIVQAEKDPAIHTIVIDTMTTLMDMYESMHVLTATNTMAAWGAYAQYWKKLMTHYVARSSKNIIILAHTTDLLNEADMTRDTLVKVKGSLMDKGIESYFSTVVSCKKLPTKQLKNYESKLLNYTKEETDLEYKYVFQTKLTKDTVNERIRSSIGMWEINETYIDNNIQYILDKLVIYYS